MKRKRTRGKKTKPILFVQGCGIYPDEFVVSCGATHAQTLAFAKKVAKPEFVKWIDQLKTPFELIQKEKKGIYCWSSDVEGTLLLLRPYEKTWDFWETLIHEISHIVFRVSTIRGTGHEDESTAHFFEYLFRSIRRRLMHAHDRR